MPQYFQDRQAQKGLVFPISGVSYIGVSYIMQIYNITFSSIAQASWKSDIIYASTETS